MTIAGPPAVEVPGRRAGGVVAPLRRLGETLGPGEAVAAPLVQHRWAPALEDAVARTGGPPLANEFLEGDAAAKLPRRVSLATAVPSSRVSGDRGLAERR